MTGDPSALTHPVCRRVDAALDVVAATEVRTGGSPATVHFLTSSDESRYVMKLLIPREDVVHGHDVGSFVAKARQVSLGRQRSSFLRQAYGALCMVVRDEAAVATVYRFKEGADLAQVLSRASKPSAPALEAPLARFVKALIHEGYAVDSRPTAGSFVEEFHLRRLLERRAYACRHGDSSLQAVLAAEEVVVNGEMCHQPMRILDALRDPSRQSLEPRRLYFPAHGDLNVRNIVVDCRGHSPQFSLIDPRGTLAWWDPAYDVAKLLFTARWYDDVMRRGCRVKVSLEAGRPHVVLEDASDSPVRELAWGLAKWVDGPTLDSVFDAERWRERVLMSMALHSLCEAACRLSDPRSVSAVSGREGSPQRLALMFYALGLLLFQRFEGALADGGASLADIVAAQV